MEDVDYDASWRALLNEVRHRVAHAPNCSVIPCDGYSERWLSSTRSILHVYVRDESGRLFIEVSSMEEGKTECAIICAHFQPIEVCERNVLYGSRAYSSIPKSEASVLFVLTTKSVKILLYMMLVCFFLRWS